MKQDRKITWDTLEYEQKDKGADWYFALGIIAVSASVASFLLGNILFSILILIGALTLAMYGARKPATLNIEIDDRGILISNTLYPFNTLKSFWIEENTTPPKIIIQSEKTFMPYLILSLEDTDTDNVRIFLLEHLKEEELTEPLSQKVMEYLGF